MALGNFHDVPKMADSAELYVRFTGDLSLYHPRPMLVVGMIRSPRLQKMSGILVLNIRSETGKEL
jgi:hypothetical protein